MYTLLSKSWSKTYQVFNGGYKLLLAEENIGFFHFCCKTSFLTGKVLRKRLATQTLQERQCLPLHARWWRKYTVSGKTTEVLNASHGTVVLAVRLVQFNSTPESYISKQEKHSILNKTPRAFLHLDSWRCWHLSTSRKMVSSYKLIVIIYIYYYYYHLCNYAKMHIKT